MTDDFGKRIGTAVQWINAIEEEFKKTDKANAVRIAELAMQERWAYRTYLDGIADYFLSDATFPRAAIQPLCRLADKISSLDNAQGPAAIFGARDPNSKPVNRLMAEGHIVGCVIYLTDVVGDGIMFACKAVASMFGHIGHRGRIKERLHSPLQKKGLSASTVHQWYSELGRSFDRDERPKCLRQLAKIAAFESLAQAERDRPIMHLPTEEFRTELAKRVMTLATQTLIEGGTGWRRDLPEKSE